jgi:hypothetical protein
MIRITTIAAALATAAAAQASFTQIETDSVFGQFQPNEDLAVPQFNGNPADLISVAIEIEATVDLEHFVELTGGSAGGGWDYSTDWSLNIDTPNGLNAIDLADVFESSGDLDAPDGVLDFDGPSGETVTDQAAGSFSIILNASTDDLSAFIGSGDAVFPVTTDAFFSGNTSGSGGGGASTTLNADTTVTYTFVPTPGTAGIAALAGLAATRRRR